MVFRFMMPGWMARRYVIRKLERSSWLMGMADRRTTTVHKSYLFGLVEFGATTGSVEEFLPEVRNFIFKGAEEQGCDALTFVRTVKKFPSIHFIWSWEF